MHSRRATRTTSCVVGGGVIPDDDVEELKALGVKEMMLQDTPPDAIVEMVRRVVAQRGPR